MINFKFLSGIPEATSTGGGGARCSPPSPKSGKAVWAAGATLCERRGLSETKRGGGGAAGSGEKSYPGLESGGGLGAAQQRRLAKKKALKKMWRARWRKTRNMLIKTPCCIKQPAAGREKERGQSEKSSSGP